MESSSVFVLRVCYCCFYCAIINVHIGSFRYNFLFCFFVLMTKNMMKNVARCVIHYHIRIEFKISVWIVWPVFETIENTTFFKGIVSFFSIDFSGYCNREKHDHFLCYFLCFLLATVCLPIFRCISSMHIYSIFQPVDHHSSLLSLILRFFLVKQHVILLCTFIECSVHSLFCFQSKFLFALPNNIVYNEKDI